MAHQIVIKTRNEVSEPTLKYFVAYVQKDGSLCGYVTGERYLVDRVMKQLLRAQDRAAVAVEITCETYEICSLIQQPVLHEFCQRNFSRYEFQVARPAWAYR